MTRSLLLFTLTWISLPIQSSLAFLPPPSSGSLSPTTSTTTTTGNTQLFFKSPVVQEALESCVVGRDVDPDQMIDLLQNLLKVHDLRPNQSYDWYGDLQGSWEFVFSSAIADVPLIGKNLFQGYFVPMLEIIHFDFPQQTMGMEVQFLPVRNFPTYTLKASNLKFDAEKAEVSYQMDAKKKEQDVTSSSIWKILYADGHVLAADCSERLGMVVLRRIPPSELEALKEKRGQNNKDTTSATDDN